MSAVSDLARDELAAFLLARFAEDKAAARDYLPEYEQERERLAASLRGSSFVLAPWLVARLDDPARVLVEVEAKERIVRRYVDTWNGTNLFDGDEYETVILPLLALPYANHPGYRVEWRPRDD